jgi:hypothetical protein
MQVLEDKNIEFKAKKEKKERERSREFDKQVTHNCKPCLFA